MLERKITVGAITKISPVTATLTTPSLKLVPQTQIDISKGQIFSWCIFCNDECIGYINLQKTSSNNEYTASIFIKPAYRSNGYGYEASKGVAKHLFLTKLANRISIFVPVNKDGCSLARLAEKLGMQEIRVSYDNSRLFELTSVSFNELWGNCDDDE